MEVRTPEDGLIMVIELRVAGAEDAPDIADIHINARRTEMPYLHEPLTEEETREYFSRETGNPPGCWWVACVGNRVVGYMLIIEEDLDHLYVRPGWQRRGIGLALLGKAKQLSPKRIELQTFQRNGNARAFYEAQGFRLIGTSKGKNYENEPDATYEWKG